MQIEIELIQAPIPDKVVPPSSVAQGAWLEFRGIVRGEENGQPISALEYEAYPEMAAREIRRLLEEISSRHPCLAAKIIHRIGTIPVGETAIYAGVASTHRGEGIMLLSEFMNKLKEDVPIWKRRALPLAGIKPASAAKPVSPKPPGTDSLDSARAKIASLCETLAAVRMPLKESIGHILRETVCAPNDLPDCDRSTRDGYAILEKDTSVAFQVVDTLHAADWKPRQLKVGEAVLIATGASLPCEGLRVVMQENIERTDDQVRIIKSENDSNVRRRGEEIKAGALLLETGEVLDAGKMALLASVGWVHPLVNPLLRVVHFTTGDEVVSPDQTPGPGQIRDSNSILIRGMLQPYQFEIFQGHLPEDFEAAKREIKRYDEEMKRADIVLISGGASVGDKDFTRPLLEWLGFEIIFSQVSIRPGRPVIFGLHGRRVAFGLPGNPLSHFVCFHLFVAAALAKLSGARPRCFLRGRLGAGLNDFNPRETLWPARWEWADGQPMLYPLKWSSSGDLTCLTETAALVRVPPNSSAMNAGTEVDFLPTGNNCFI